MPAKVTADYSKYPASIRDVMPYVEGEVTELRDCWQIYHFLFMDNQQKTTFLAERFGPLLAILQNLLGEQMILSIARLTDKDSKTQRNLSLWSLIDATPSAKSKDFPQKVHSAVTSISATAANIRKRRHKEVAHFDREVSIGASPPPPVLLKELRMAHEQMEEFLNLFHWEFAKTTVGFDSLSSDKIWATALETALKSKVYDELEAEKTIPFGEWKRRVEKLPWWT